MAPLPDTPAQKNIREMYDEACRQLAAAAVHLNDAQANYDVSRDRYNIAFGAAMHAGVLPK